MSQLAVFLRDLILKRGPQIEAKVQWTKYIEWRPRAYLKVRGVGGIGESSYQSVGHGNGDDFLGLTGKMHRRGVARWGHSVRFAIRR